MPFIGWAFRDSNPGPCGYEPRALTNWAKRPCRMREMGGEPTRVLKTQRSLSPSRLPIPPLPHIFYNFSIIMRVRGIGPLRKFLASDFKSGLSTSSSTPAYLLILYLILPIYCSIFQKFCQEVLLTFSLLFQVIWTSLDILYYIILITYCQEFLFLFS